MVSTAAFHARVRGSVPGLGGLKETKLFLPHPRVKVSIVGSLRDREVACSASDRQGSNFESCVWRTVSSQSSHHPQEVLLAQFSLYVHKGGLKPDSFHLLSFKWFAGLFWGSLYHLLLQVFVHCRIVFFARSLVLLAAISLVTLNSTLVAGYRSCESATFGKVNCYPAVVTDKRRAMTLILATLIIGRSTLLYICPL